MRLLLSKNFIVQNIREFLFVLLQAVGLGQGIGRMRRACDGAGDSPAPK
jgi:hypothetical protein